MDTKFVLWGHDLAEYQDMFDLTEDDLQLNLLEFGAGPSSFNAQMHALGHQVTSCDTLFSLNELALKEHVADTFSSTLEQIKRNEHGYNLKPYGDIEGLVKRREEGVLRFFDDFEQGLKQRRYLPFNPPSLPFADLNFDLALVSHNLFVNFEGQSIEQHLSVLEELLRVASEVRIFPLIDKYGQNSNLLGPVMLALQQSMFAVEVRQVASQLQPSGNAMLRVWAAQCEL